MKPSLKAKIATIIALTAILALGPGAAGAVCGDLDDDTLIADLGDVQQLLTCVVNPSAAGCSTACTPDGLSNCADVNGDGSINIADAVILLAKFNGERTILKLCTGAGSQIPCGSTISSGTIAANEVWGDGTADCELILDGLVIVDPGVVLTIRPGTVIKGKKTSSDATPSALVFNQGDCAACAAAADPDDCDFTARINAAGTPSRPIVFTSDQPPGSRAAGDWGGVAFNGCASINATGGSASAEGLTGVSFGGGSNPLENDFSGVARYVRVEFAGRELAPDNELNVWTMNAVGDATAFDYIQAHKGLDDAFEWFGGSVNMTHLVASAAGDDNLDWQLGTTAAVQFALVAQHLGSNLTSGPNGFEGDGNELGFDNGSAVETAPGTGAGGAADWGNRSNPKFCNLTLIGGGNAATNDQNGIFIRRGTAAEMGNMIVTNFERGIQVRDPETARHFCMGECDEGGAVRTDGTGTCDNSAGGTLPPVLGADFAPAGSMNGIILYGNGTTIGAADADDYLTKSGGNNTGSECNSDELGALLEAATNLTNESVDPGVSTTFPPTDPRPTNIAGVTADEIDCATLDGFFVTTSYVGGFEPGGENWLDTTGGWISFDLN